MSAPLHRPEVLVLGLGNPDRGDDGVGIRIVEAVGALSLPGAVVKLRTGDMLSLIEDWAGFAQIICVDAAAPIDRPGRVHRINALREPLPVAPGLASSHGIGLAEVVALARTLDMLPRVLTVFAVEGQSFAAGEHLSTAVAAQIAPVAHLIADEVHRLATVPGAAHA